MKKIIISSFCIALTSQMAIAQIASSGFFSRIKLRESFQSADSRPEPAKFTYTNPAADSVSYLIDAAVGYHIPGTDRLSINLTGEYHGNTLAEKKQKTVQGGLSIEIQTNRNYNTFPSGPPRKQTRWIITSTGKYSKDYINSINSMQASIELTALFNRVDREKAFLPNTCNELFKDLAIYYYPSIGLENETRLQSQSDLFEGNVLRGVGRMYVGIFPVKSFNQRLELFGSYDLKLNFLNSTMELTDGSYPFFKAGVNALVFGRPENGSFTEISFSYNTGSDPIKGLKEQKYLALTLIVKI